MATAVSNSDPTTNPPPQRRRWIPVSLRIFTVLLLVLTGISAFCWWRAHRVMELESSVARDLAAEMWAVHYDYEEFAYGYDPAQPQFPRYWYHVIMPDGGRPRIVFVSLPTTLSESCRAELIERVARLPLVRHLCLGSLHIVSDSEGEEQIERQFYGEKIVITEHDCARIGSMSQLEILDLTGTSTTDAGLSRLHRLVNLKRIWLRGTNVTAAGVRRLQAALPKAEVYSRFTNP